MSEQERIKTEQMVRVLSEAQPYICNYRAKTIVVKYGGSAMENEKLKAAAMNDLVTLSLLGVRVILVHGGGPEINSQLLKMGKEPKFVNGLRLTDGQTMDVVQQVLAGKVNKDLVALLRGYGVGLCGMDGNILKCVKKKTNPDLGFVGSIKNVDTTLINFLMESGYIPVIATVGMDENGVAYNINADTAACKIAIALKAEKLISMTDVVGILQDKDDDNTLIEKIEINEVETLMESGIISGGMIPKINGCVSCIKNGVRQAAIIDGRMEHSVLMEIFSNKGSGTLFYKAEEKG